MECIGCVKEAKAVAAYATAAGDKPGREVLGDWEEEEEGVGGYHYVVHKDTGAGSWLDSRVVTFESPPGDRATTESCRQ